MRLRTAGALPSRGPQRRSRLAATAKPTLLSAFAHRCFGIGPDGEPILIEDDFAETDVRDDLRTCFSDRRIDDTDATGALFAELVDLGLTVSLDESGGEPLYYHYLGGKEFEDRDFQQYRGSLAWTAQVIPGAIRRLPLQNQIRSVFGHLSKLQHSRSPAAGQDPAPRSGALLSHSE